MRIIAGSLSGRQFVSPHGQRTHPMADKVRGALFNALGDISGLSVLDAFAGSGALSFEAISRGAGSALAIETDRQAQRTIAENSRQLGLGNVKLIRAAAGAWLTTSQEMFDLVLLDPPYDKLQTSLLSELAARANPGGTIVISLPPDSDFQLPATSYELLAKKSYGDASLDFYRRT